MATQKVAIIFYKGCVLIKQKAYFLWLFYKFCLIL